MEGVVFGVFGVVVLAYLLQPLVVESVEPLWNELEWLPESETESSTSETQLQPDSHDNVRICYNCGTHVDGPFTYCGECLTPLA